MIAAGEMDRLIRIQFRTETRSSTGQSIDTYVSSPDTSIEVWARRDTSSREFFRAAQVNAKITARYVIRYRADVTETCRIVDGALELNIESADQTDDRPPDLAILASGFKEQ